MQRGYYYHGKSACQSCRSAAYKLQASSPFEEIWAFGHYVKRHATEPVGYWHFSFQEGYRRKRKTITDVSLCRHQCPLQEISARERDSPCVPDSRNIRLAGFYFLFKHSRDHIEPQEALWGRQDYHQRTVSAATGILLPRHSHPRHHDTGCERGRYYQGRGPYSEEIHEANWQHPACNCIKP